ncbi:MAG: CDP-diacylglycerol--glycerol-3-phosphate 3-phosphatidyltransferase [Alphaproteobacteria bacterium]|nr:CDP-diacylglycerol--glycerol-3-phosphate 3-phosphatidyltransferase [Alphaproteobacteria bacterium]
MKKFVNFLSIFRIITAFAIIPLFLFQMHWTVFILFILAALSDFFDGYLAKKYNVTSKIGGVLDHIGDKLLVVNSMIILVVMMRVWFIMVPIILMIAREIYISGLREFLGTQKIEMPVPKERFSIGKIKTTLQMITIGAFFLLIAIGSSITQPITSKILMFSLITLPYICIWGLWLSLIASLWSATTYTIDFKKKIKKLK